MNPGISKEQFGSWKGSVPVNLSNILKLLVFFSLAMLCFMFVTLVQVPLMAASPAFLTGLAASLTGKVYEHSRLVSFYQKGVIIPAVATGSTKVMEQYFIEYATVTGLVLEENAVVLKRKDDQYRILKKQFTEYRFNKIGKKLSEKLEDKMVDPSAKPEPAQN
jgi:hypothetical protein